MRLRSPQRRAGGCDAACRRTTLKQPKPRELRMARWLHRFAADGGLPGMRTYIAHIGTWVAACAFLFDAAACAPTPTDPGLPGSSENPPPPGTTNPPASSPDASGGTTVPSDDAGTNPPPVSTDAGNGPDGKVTVPDAGPDSGPTPTSSVRVVGYLPNYSGSYADWAAKIDFTKMTHLNLAFASATSSNDWDMGAPDDQVKALVDAAHAAGTKVLASLGGGGGDQTVIARYKDPSNVPDLATKLDAFVAAHNFDGADVDIEDGSNLGANYSTFITAIVGKLRPEGKLVTAAVAQYLQDSMADDTLHQFDFVNVMVYSNYADGVTAMDYYTATKSVPKLQVVLGAGFFGSDSSGTEYAYSDILKADSNAWNADQAQVNGNTVNYTGMASMKKIAEYSKGFGGIMFWELSEDVTDSHSLYKVIQSTM
jgi:chitinase